MPTFDKGIQCEALSERLASAGQVCPFAVRWNQKSPTDVFPSAESIVTVSREEDVTMDEEYRSHFFKCVETESEVPVLISDAEFAPAVSEIERTRREDECACDFDQGPMVWLTKRMLVWERFLIWPQRGGPTSWRKAWPHVLDQAEFCHFDDVARIVKEIQRRECFAFVGAIETQDDWNAVLRLGSLVGMSICDLYVASEDLMQVYLMHHHDMIIVSCSDDAERLALLQELVSRRDLFEDISGYE